MSKTFGGTVGRTGLVLLIALLGCLFSLGFLFTTVLPALAYSDLGEPATLEVTQIRVFSGYLEEDDQLYVFRTKVVYNTTPDETAGEYYVAQLLSGETIKGQYPLAAWNYSVCSIYLNADSALDWGGSYAIQVIGRDSRFADPPSVSVSLNATDWVGVDLNQLDSWVKTSGVALESYYDADYLEVYENELLLNEAGGAIFVAGIPDLSNVRPEIFLYEGYEPPEVPDFEEPGYSFDAAGIFNTLGDAFHISGSFLMILFGFGFAALTAGVAMKVGASLELAMVCGFILAYLMFFFLGMVPLWTVTIPVSLIVFFVVWQTVMKGV